MFLAFHAQVTRGCVFCIRRSASGSSGLRNAAGTLYECDNRALAFTSSYPGDKKPALSQGIMLHAGS